MCISDHVDPSPLKLTKKHAFQNQLYIYNI